MAALHGDIQGTRYSPLDQINASNFSKLEVAWRFKTDSLGPRPEYKLEGTPIMVKGVLYTTAGTRRSVVALDGKTGELIWAHSLREGKRAAIAPRQLSGRGVSYWTDGRGDERIIYVTTGYRLVALNAKTGAMISSFGTDGMVDLKVGVVYGNGQPIDLETGEIGVHSTPTVVKDVVIVGSSFREGATVPTHNNTKGLVRAFDVAHRQAALDVQHHSAARRSRQRDLGEQFVGGQRQHRRVDADHGRRGARPGLPAGRDADRRTITAAIVPATTCSPKAWSCVDLKTGQRKWHFQFVHHPIWNYDMSSAPILADINVNGRAIKAVAVPSKQGWLYVFDRVTGQPVWPIEERPVPQSDVPGEKTSPTQPFPTKPPAVCAQLPEGAGRLIDFTPELRAQALEVTRSATRWAVAVQRRRCSATSTASSARSMWATPSAAPTGRARPTIRKRTPSSRRRDNVGRTSRSLVRAAGGVLRHPLRLGHGRPAVPRSARPGRLLRGRRAAGKPIAATDAPAAATGALRASCCRPAPAAVAAAA